jgi:uncharacterized repeat protein (TIGR01451 family)
MKGLFVLRSKLIIGFVLACLTHCALSVQVFQDNFNRADNTTIGSNWVEVTTGFGGNAQISTNTLLIGNGATSGRTYIYQVNTNWNTNYHSTLSQNIGLASWRFNLRVNRANLSGFGLANYGVGVVLAGSSTNFLAGNGYAMVWGQNLTDPLRLVRYANGLQTSTSITLSNIITTTDGGFTNMITDYYSFRVTYDSDTGIWEVYARNDGTNGFADPATGTLSLVGAVADTTYTGTALNYMGVLWNYGTTLSQNAYFDNLTVDIIQLPPSIVNQPTSTLVIRGTPGTVNVTASGTRPLRYQWRFNGIPLSGQTNATLSLSNFVEANEGNYSVVITNTFGSITSVIAALAISRDFGDAPAFYPTLSLNSGARHIIVPGIYLGALVDGETNGAPSTAAMGDDQLGQADEDGVMFISRVAAGQTASVRVTASTNGYLNAWMDFNQNGSWLDTGEQIFAGQALSVGENAINFSVPFSATTGTNAYCRFRFTSAGGLGFITGEAADGEVEDYQVAIDTPADVGIGATISPNPVAIGSNITYVVTVTNLGPSQASGIKLTNTLPALVNFVSASASQGSVTQIGGTVICDFGGLFPGKKATLTITAVPTNEGLASFSSVISRNESDPVAGNNSASASTTVLPRPVIVTQPISLTVTNDDSASFSVGATGTGTLHYQWRFNGGNLAFGTNSTLVLANVQSTNAGSYDVVVNDSVGSAVSDTAALTVLVRPFISSQPQSQIVNIGGSASLNVIAGGTPTLNYQWYFNVTNLLSGQTSTTFQINNAQTNNAGDYFVVVSSAVGVVTSVVASVSVQPMDFGDAPTNYPTLLTSNGARHIISDGVYLGNGLNQDADGKPDVAANGDDADDGISFVTNMVAGQTAAIQIVASTNGYLSGWIDFDQTGNWNAAYKHIFESQAVTNGTNILSFEVPYFAQVGTTFARFRFTTSTNAISHDGLAMDGEVEDYQVSISPAVPVALLISTQPPEFATAGVPFEQQPVILMADNRGQPVFSDSATVVTASREAGVGTLQGDVSVTAVNGYVTFTNLYHTLVSDITIQFSSAGFSTVTSTVVSVSHNVASTLTVQTQPSSSAIAGQIFPQQPIVRVTDNYGNLIPEDNGTLITAARAAGLGTLQGSLVQSTTNGVATFTNLSHQVANTISLGFSSPGLANGTSASLTITPTNVSKLAFVTQPAGAVAGAAFTTQPAVQTQDIYGNASDLGLGTSLIVTQVLTSGTGPLQGTTNLDIGTAAGNGQVTFGNLRIDAAGTGKQLTARTAALTNALSSTFSVSAGSFTKLQLLAPGETAAPSTTNGKTGTPSSQVPDVAFNVTVNAVDAFWNIVSSASDTIRIGLSDTNVIPLVDQFLTNGTKSVSVTMTTPGTNVVTATDVTSAGKTPATNSIPVSTGQYTFATGGGAISADATGVSYTNLTGPVYREAASADASGNGSGPWSVILNAPAGFIFDTNTVNPPGVIITRIGGTGSNSRNINGVASPTLVSMTSPLTSTQLVFTITGKSSGGVTCSLTWTNVRVRPLAGSPLARGNLTLSGTASLVGVPSGANFGPLREIPGTARRLVMVTQPAATATAGVIFSQQPAVGIADQFGNVRCSTNGTPSPDNSSVIIAARNAGSGTLQGTLSATASDSIASFTNLSHTVANTININFTNATLATNVNSSSIVVNPAPADRLVFATQPGSAVVGQPFGVQPVVLSRDAFSNNSAVGLPTTLNVSMTLSGGTGPLSGTTTRNIGKSGGNGAITNTDLRIDSVGSDKQLTASASGLNSAVSSVFAVSKGNQTITFPALSNRVYGETFTAVASASSGLPVGLEVLSAPATNSGNVVTVTGVGLVTVRATQAGDANWNAAPSVDRQFTATKAGVVVAITSSPNPSLPSQEVTFSANLTAAFPGSGTPSGSVQFSTNGSALGAPIVLTSGSAGISAALTQHGSNTVSVAYDGDAYFYGATNSLNPKQVVNTPPIATNDIVLRPAGQGVKVLVATLVGNDWDADSDVLTVSGINSNSTSGGVVILESGWVHYTPPSGLTNDDSFVYQLADTFGGAAEGTVTVVISSNTAPTMNLVIEDLGNGSFRLSFDGIPGEPYQIQWASNLTNPDWQTLTVQSADPQGRFEYVDTPPVGAGTRYYRSATP